VIVLPMLAPPLRDNQRLHWAVKARITAQLRRDMPTLARAAGVPTGLGRVLIVLHWQPKLCRGRDQLSIAPTLKPLVDGLVDYGLVPDDTTAYVDLTCRIEPLGPKAAVWLTIEEIA
jgi:crossover junction endodeoxyribonuclease RusA